MTATRIADVIDPEILGDMIVELLPNNNILLPGVFTSSEFPLGTKGTIWEIPYNEPIGALETYVPGTSLTVQGLAQDKYRMPVIRKAGAYGADKIVKLAGYQSPMIKLPQAMANKIMEQYMNTQIQILSGASEVANYQNSSSTIISDVVVYLAKDKLGDKAGTLKYILMHSKCFQALQTANKIVYQAIGNIIPVTGTLTNQQGKDFASGLVPTIAGLIIVQSDNCQNVSGNIYTSYLLSESAMGHYWQQQVNVDIDYDTLAKEDIVSPDVDYVMCVHGVDYTATAYTDTAIATPGNYALKWDKKLVGVVKLNALSS